jgi:hypothetical protein
MIGFFLLEAGLFHPLEYVAWNLLNVKMTTLKKKTID